MTQVAFLHVPKTAGTTLHKLIEENLGPIAFYPPRSSPEVQERFGTVFSDFIARAEAADPEARAALLEAFHKHPAVGGHTTSAILPYLSPDRFVFTSLREPGDRLVSWYFHYVHPDDPEKMHRPFREQTKDMSFDQFVRFKPMMSENDNVMVRYFANVDGKTPVSAEHLEQAKTTLASLDMILFQKAQTEGQKALGETLGWDIPEEAEKLKRSRNRVRLGKGFGYTKSIMNRYIKFDRQLLEFARQLPQAVNADQTRQTA